MGLLAELSEAVASLPCETTTTKFAAFRSINGPFANNLIFSLVTIAGIITAATVSIKAI